jgi:chromosome segregation ATPase
MSTIGASGGNFPSATAGADGVLALLTVLANPKLHKERLDQLLQAETSARSVHDAALQASKNLADDRASVERAHRAVTDLGAKLEQDQALHRERTAAIDNDLKGREAGLLARDQAHEQYVKYTTDAITQKNDELSARETALDARETAVAKREKAADRAEARIAAKLAKIKEFEEA